MPPRAATLPLLLVQGSWSEARDLARITRVQGSPLERHMATTILGNLAYCQGGQREAWAMVRDLVPRGPDSEPEDGLFPYAIEMLRLATRLTLDAGDTASAGDWLRAHDRWLDWSGSTRGRAESSLLKARIHEHKGDLAKADEAAEDALRRATDPRQPLVLQQIHHFRGQVAMNDERYVDAECQMHLALDLAAECAAPYERARALLLLADLYARTGRAHDARPLIDEVRTIAGNLEVDALLSEIDDLESGLATATSTSSLTPREIEVLQLVAQGITDAEVAEHLYISPRTVGQHLRSIYNKLGVSSRTAATSAAIKDNLV
jgi:ATP/maltotriose-dependent transcriptional regulator MalT